jgi:hypothetical protein
MRENNHSYLNSPHPSDWEIDSKSTRRGGTLKKIKFIYTYMRREYQIRWNEEIIFRSDSWRTTNAMLDKAPEDSYIYEDVYFDNEPTTNI